MSTAVYAVHAAQWARNNPRWELSIWKEVQRRLRLFKAPPKADRWSVVYSTMQRQWQEEQAQLLARSSRLQGLRQYAGKLGAWFRSRPITSSSVSGLVMLFTSDLIIQKAVEKKQQIDFRRTAYMSAFGLGFVGFAQHFIYTSFWPMMLQATGLTGIRAVIFQVIGDQGVYMPALYLPIYYGMKEMACAGQIYLQTALRGVKRCHNNLASDVQMACSYWVPVQVLNFGLMPLTVRVLFMSGAGLLYQLLLGAAALSHQ
ncbi:unnamed protein product [Effrenium voratum]|nr:unnamed protein product [Effrenium voratum]